MNKLIPPGSGLQLTNAIDINERGEILAKSVPIGVTPIDDQDLGHLVLLIPRHEEDKDFDSSLDSEEAGSHEPLASVVKTPATSTISPAHAITPREKAAAYRAKLARQFPIPVTAPPKN